MAKVQTIPDIGFALKTLKRKVDELQQLATGPTVMGTDPNPTFDTITIGNFEIVSSVSAIEPAPGQTALAPLLLTPGSYMDDIFMDVEWGAPLDGSGVVYEVEIAKEDSPGVFSLSDVTTVGGTSVRFRGLEPVTSYGFRVTVINAYGFRAGPSPAVYQSALSIKDTTIPPAVIGVVVGRGATTVVVKFTPLTSGDAADVASGRGEYQIQISTSATFATLAAEKFSGDQIVAFNDIFTEGTYYARVRAIDSSGNIGPWSTIAGPATAGGVIDSMIVAGLDAAKITVGFLSASRIQTGSLVADKLSTSTLTASTITVNGGAIKVGNPPTTGLLINSQGIRLYGPSGLTVSLDAATGFAAFVGFISASAISASTITGGTLTGTTIYSGTGDFRLHDGGLWLAEASRGSDNSLIISSAFGVQDGLQLTSFVSEVNFDTHWAAVFRTGLSGINRWCQIQADDGLTTFGTLDVNGDFYVLGGHVKSFLIDHPVTPDTELLQHACLEGPEVGVFYRGRVTLHSGSADVSLPSYFEALTQSKDRTVALGVVGNTPCPVSASEVVDGGFTIFGESDVDVWWSVFAVRSDLPDLQTEISKAELRAYTEAFVPSKTGERA